MYNLVMRLNKFLFNPALEYWVVHSDLDAAGAATATQVKETSVRRLASEACLAADLPPLQRELLQLPRHSRLLI